MSKDRLPLTKTKIDKAEVPPGARQFWLWDTAVTGFGVRCLPGGSKTLIFRYRPRGGSRSVNPRYLRIGGSPRVSVLRSADMCTSCGIIGADARPNWAERQAQG